MQTSTKSVGGIFSSALALYRSRFSYFITAALCFLIPYHIVHLVVVSQHSVSAADVQKLLSTSTAPTFKMLEATGAGWSFFILLLYLLLVSPLLYGLIANTVVQKRMDGSDLPLGDGSSIAFRRLLPAIGTYLLLGAIFLIGLVIGSFLIGMLTGVLGALGKGSVVLGVVGIIILIVAAAWLALRLSMTPSVVLCEQAAGLQAIRVSWKITKKNTIRLLGFYLLMFVIVILRLAVTLLLAMVLGYVGLLIALIIIDILLVPYVMIVTADMYVWLREPRSEDQHG